MGIHNVSQSLIHQDDMCVASLCIPLQYMVDFITVEVSTVSDSLHSLYVITYLGKIYIDYIHSNKGEKLGLSKGVLVIWVSIGRPIICIFIRFICVAKFRAVLSVRAIFVCWGCVPRKHISLFHYINPYSTTPWYANWDIMFLMC